MIPALVWTAAILIALGWPASGLPSIQIEHVDKIVHFGLFFVFAFLWMIALPLRPGPRTWVVLITGVLFAIGTELYQGIIPSDRSASLWDVVADVFGLCMGIMLYHILALRRLRKRRVYK
jgi:VanZ family protein